MTEINTFDIAIVGAGVTGSLLAHILSQELAGSVKIALIDPAFITKTANVFDHDWSEKSRRVSAINTAIYNQLQNLVRFPLHEIAEPLQNMQVYTPEFGGHFTINAAEFNYESLAYVVENDALAQVLLKELSTEVYKCDQEVIQIQSNSCGYKIETKDFQLQSKFLVGADGTRSSVAQKLSIQKNPVGRSATAVAAQIKVPEFKSFKTARQWFLNDGSILGLLPVKQAKNELPIMSMVWSMPKSIADVKTINSDTFKSILLELMSFTSEYDEFKHFEFFSEPQVWPLHRGFVNTKNMAKDFPGLFLIGDAAHTIHPLAGQGLNLGLEDSFKLAKNLKEIIQHKKSLKLNSALYHAQRAYSVNLMMKICEGLKNNFETRSWASKLVSAAAFNIFNKHYLIKNQVVKMMSF